MRVFLTIILLFSVIFSQEISLKGVVIDLDKKPIEGVEVTLKNKPLLVTYTDKSGTFILRDDITNLKGKSFKSLYYKSSNIPFVYNTKGQKILSSHKNLPKGLYLKHDSKNIYLNRYFYTNKVVAETFHSSSILAKRLTEIDTVVFNKAGFKERKSVIDGYWGLVDTITLLPEKYSVKSPKYMKFVKKKTEGLLHRVHYDFFMDSIEVTYGMYKEYMGFDHFSYTGDHKEPIHYISWQEAILFCNERSKREGRDTVYTYKFRVGDATPSCNPCTLSTVYFNTEAEGYRLPTRYEWSHAFYGFEWDNESCYPWGNESMGVRFYGWDITNSGDRTYHHGAQLRPSEFGIYDMLGNVEEMCHLNLGDSLNLWCVRKQYCVISLLGLNSNDDIAKKINFNCKYTNPVEASIYPTGSMEYNLEMIGFRCVVPIKKEEK